MRLFFWSLRLLAGIIVLPAFPVVLLFDKLTAPKLVYIKMSSSRLAWESWLDTFWR